MSDDGPCGSSSGLTLEALLSQLSRVGALKLNALSTLSKDDKQALQENATATQLFEVVITKERKTIMIPSMDLDVDKNPLTWLFKVLDCDIFDGIPQGKHAYVLKGLANALAIFPHLTNFQQMFKNCNTKSKEGLVEEVKAWLDEKFDPKHPDTPAKIKKIVSAAGVTLGEVHMNNLVVGKDDTKFWTKMKGVLEAFKSTAAGNRARKPVKAPPSFMRISINGAIIDTPVQTYGFNVSDIKPDINRVKEHAELNELTVEEAGQQLDEIQAVTAASQLEPRVWTKRERHPLRTVLDWFNDDQARLAGKSNQRTIHFAELYPIVKRLATQLNTDTFSLTFIEKPGADGRLKKEIHDGNHTLTGVHEWLAMYKEQDGVKIYLWYFHNKFIWITEDVAMKKLEHHVDVTIKGGDYELAVQQIANMKNHKSHEVYEKVYPEWLYKFFACAGMFPQDDDGRPILPSVAALHDERLWFQHELARHYGDNLQALGVMEKLQAHALLTRTKMPETFKATCPRTGKLVDYKILLQYPRKEGNVYNARGASSNPYNPQAEATFNLLRAHGIEDKWGTDQLGLDPTAKVADCLGFQDAYLLRCILDETQPHYGKTTKELQEELSQYAAKVLGKETFEEEDFKNPVLAEHLAELFQWILEILEALLVYNAYGTSASLTPLVLKLWLTYQRNKSEAMDELEIPHFALVMSVCKNKFNKDDCKDIPNFWEMVYTPAKDLHINDHVNIDFSNRQILHTEKYNEAMKAVATNMGAIVNEETLAAFPKLLHDDQKVRAGLMERPSKKAKQ